MIQTWDAVDGDGAAQAEGGTLGMRETTITPITPCIYATKVLYGRYAWCEKQGLRREIPLERGAIDVREHETTGYACERCTRYRCAVIR